MTSTNLAGKIAVVTGAGAGIGARTARLLGDRGAHVVVVDRDIEAGQRTAQSIPSAVSIQLDLSNDAAIEVALDTHSELTNADILVNNAGVTRVERFIESDPASWDLMWRVNLRAPMRLSQAVLPSMIERGGGRIVFVSTDSARAGGGGEGVYSATKSGLLGFAKTIARESARSAVTSNVVCPGLIDTGMLTDVRDGNPTFMDKLRSAIPMKRLGTSDEVADAIVFLCSAESSYITGQVLSVNGGITMM